MPLTIEPLTALPADLAVLEAQSVAQGFSMLTRLRVEWESGENRFHRAGEILLGAFRNRVLIGTGGLNVDPYLDDPDVGRLRHVYVLESERRSGAGRALIVRLLEQARGRFSLVRLSTGQAAGFYEALGFSPVDLPKATHVIAP